jgi:hypothetical protein
MEFRVPDFVGQRFLCSLSHFSTAFAMQSKTVASGPRSRQNPLK